MRKHLLLSLGLAVTYVMAYSQSNLPAKNTAQEIRAKAAYLNGQDGTPTLQQSLIKKTVTPLSANGGLRSLTETKFASSHNGFTLLVSESNPLTANTDLNLISFTHRACESIVQNGGNSGYIQSSFSKDGGLTFDTSKTVMTQTEYLCRYPAGGIVNPPGNTNPDMAFTVVSGPATTSAGGWDDYYYGSMRFDGDHNHQLTYNTYDNGVTQWMPRYSFTTARDKAFVLGANWDYNTLTDPYYDHIVNRAVYNQSTNEFDWTQIAIPTTYALDAYGAQLFFNLGGSIAFNEDGSLGYVVVIGVDEASPLGYFPIIFKSTDFGVTWVKQTTFDFGSIPAWGDYLIPMANGNYKPFFNPGNGIDIGIDGNNNLHIVTVINSAYSDNFDSLGYTFNASTSAIFDVYQFGDVWDITYVDTIAALDGASAAWTSASGTVYTDARLQISWSPDKKRLMAVWADTDPGVSGGNDYPDVFGKGIDYSKVDKEVTSTINFTGLTNYAYSNSWMYVSDHAFDNGGGIITVPVTVSKSRDESFVMDNVMDHYFVSDISFPFTVGINEVENVASLSASVYPNPATDVATIKINVQTAGKVTVKVTDIFGKTVSSNNYTYKSGNHFVTFDRKDLSNGVYFYNVTNGKDEVSGKIVLQ